METEQLRPLWPMRQSRNERIGVITGGLSGENTLTSTNQRERKWL
jgi:hypothetical protein